jgi:ribosomal protein L24
LDHRLSSTPLIQPSFDPDDDIQIGDHVQVLSGQHKNKRGVVEWSEGTHLWFVDETRGLEDTDLGIRVLVEIVRRVQIPDVLKFTKERGYDVKPGDRVRVARGSHYKATGIVQSVDFPNARLTLKCDSGDALVSTILLTPSHANSIFVTGRHSYSICGHGECRVIGHV